MILDLAAELRQILAELVPGQILLPDELPERQLDVVDLVPRS